MMQSTPRPGDSPTTCSWLLSDAGAASLDLSADCIDKCVAGHSGGDCLRALAHRYHSAKGGGVTAPKAFCRDFVRRAPSTVSPRQLRKKIDHLPRGADERDRAKFANALSYMVLLDDKVGCKNIRCRKRFDISGVKTMAYLSETGGLPQPD